MGGGDTGELFGNGRCVGCGRRFAAYLAGLAGLIVLFHGLHRAGLVSHGPREDLFLVMVMAPLLFLLARRQAGLEAAAADRVMFGAVMDCAPPICVTGDDFVIRYANRGYVETFGPVRPGATHCYESRPGDGCRTPACPLEMAGRDETGVVCETVKHDTALGKRRFLVTAVPVRRARGGFAGVVEVFTDVTRQRATERRQADQRRLLGLAGAAAGMAHDFNNLLTVVFGNQELAAAMVDEPAAREALAGSAAALEEARRLTSRLLLLAGDGRSGRRVVGDLVPLAERAFTRGFDPDRGRVVFERGEGLPRVSFAPAQMEEAFCGLGAACGERMESGGEVGFVSRRVVLEDDNDLGLAAGEWLSIIVREPGAPLDPMVVERMFEPYFSLSGLDSRKGHGLEMAVAFAVAVRHGGMVAIEPEGDGNRLEMLLPAAGPRPGGDAGPERDAGPEAVCEKTVFILEDDPAVAGTVAGLCGSLGFGARVFSAAADLVEAFAAAGTRPGTVILDLHIDSGMGGLACLRRLQEIDPRVRAVAMSGRVDDDIMADPRGFGFACALAKPFSLHDLGRVLSR